jgi:hypothetical protein
VAPRVDGRSVAEDPVSTAIVEEEQSVTPTLDPSVTARNALTLYADLAGLVSANADREIGERARDGIAVAKKIDLDHQLHNSALASGATPVPEAPSLVLTRIEGGPVCTRRAAGRIMTILAVRVSIPEAHRSPSEAHRPENALR